MQNRLLKKLCLICVVLTESNYLYSFHNQDSIKINYIDGRIIVSSYVNDSIPAELLLDSGTSAFLLDSMFLSKINSFIVPGWTIKGKSLDGTGYLYPLGTKKDGQNYLLQKMNLQINGLPFEADRPLATNLFPYEVDGILGIVNLSRKDKIVEVNVCSKKISLVNQIPEAFKEIPFTIDKESGSPIIELTIKIQAPSKIIEHTGKFIIDTGFRSGLILPESAKKEYLDMDMFESNFLIGATGISAISKSIRNVPVSIENIKLSNFTIYFNPYVSKNIKGIIGMQFLKNIIFALDYNKRKFYYLPNDSIANESLINETLFSKYGLSIDLLMFVRGKSDCIFVCSLIKNGKAEQLGIKLNDKILKINDINIDEQTDRTNILNLETYRSLTIKTETGDIYVLE